MNSPPSVYRRSKAASSSPVVLSDELISEILSLLSVKTLMQMKCVCKSWKTTISDPSFVKLHLQRSPRNTHLALMPLWSMPDEEMDFSFVPFTISRLVENPKISIPYNPYYRLKDMDCCQVVGSCNGLICLLDFDLTGKYQNISLRFWNPAIKTISDKLGYFSNDRHNCVSEFFRFTFGYDNSSDTYKVVGFCANKVKVFSLGNNVWRNIQSFPVVPFGLCAIRHCHPFVNYGVHLSGTINWLTIRNKTEYDWNDITIEQFAIVSLDLGTETYRQLLPPPGFVEVPPVEPSVTALMDCLCFSYSFKGTYFVLWKMIEFGVQESWIQFLKISYQNLQIDYGISNWLDVEYDSQLFLFPLCLSESSDTLIMASNQEIYLYAEAIIYNWSDNRVARTRFNDEILWFFAKDYTESLVSPF
uniref:F-box/kelch-repeat protein At3g23880-like n=1 Tax=Cicer arietinum TaxID=3827 RepID=A0A1S2XPY8_CICAR|nr:F-box/kelch-repeat protein At3g23880-like [Cicer arietinum]